KVSALRRILEDYATGLATVGARAHAGALIELADGLAPFGKREISDLKLAETSHRHSRDTGKTLRDALGALEAFQAFITRTAKPSVRDALNQMRIFLNDRQHMTIRSFVDALHAAFSPERP